MGIWATGEEAQVPICHIRRVILCASQNLVELADIFLQHARDGADGVAEDVNCGVEAKRLVRLDVQVLVRALLGNKSPSSCGHLSIFNNFLTQKKT